MSEELKTGKYVVTLTVTAEFVVGEGDGLTKQDLINETMENGEVTDTNIEKAE